MKERCLDKRNNILWKEIESKSVLLNLDSGSYHTLNKTGTMILSFVDKNITVEDIILKVFETYEVDRDQAEKEVEAFIADLLNQGLIKLTEKHV